MKNFNNKKLSSAEARSVNGKGMCGRRTNDRKYKFNIVGNMDCRDAEFQYCRWWFPNDDIVGAKTEYRSTVNKTDVTCYIDNWECSGSLIWC